MNPASCPAVAWAWTFWARVAKHLKNVDLLIGADVCFWDSLVKPLKNLILRALRTNVQQVLISDPGRPPFEEIGEYFASKRGGEILDWTAQRPRRSEGRILKIGNIADSKS